MTIIAEDPNEEARATVIGTDISNVKNNAEMDYAPVYSWKEEEYLQATGVDDSELSEEKLEFVRAEVEAKEYREDKEGMTYSWIVLLLLLMV